MSKRRQFAAEFKARILLEDLDWETGGHGQPQNVTCPHKWEMVRRRLRGKPRVSLVVVGSAIISNPR